MFAFALAGAIPLLVLGLAQASRWSASQIATSDDQMLQAARAVAYETKSLLHHHILALESISAQTTSFNRLSGPQVQQSLELYRNIFGLRYVYNIRLDGIVASAFPLIGADSKSTVGVDFSQREYFVNAKAGRAPFIAPLRIGKFSGMSVFGLAVPVWNPERTELIGVVGSTLQPVDVLKVIEPVLDAGRGLKFVVANGFGQVVVEDDVAPGKEIKNSELMTLLNFAQDESPVIVLGKDEDGRAVRGAVVRMRIFNAEWKIAVYQHVDKIAALARAARSQVLWAAAALFGLSLLLALGISQKLSRPVVDLIDAMKRIGDGNYDGLGRKHSSFGELSGAWDALLRMAGQLKVHGERLEHLVEERTRQLQQASRELEQQRARSAAAAKFAALGRMAGGVAHEINTPLASISLVSEMTLELMDRKGLQSPEVTSAFQQIMRTVDRISKITQGLRSFSRDASKEPLTQVRLADLLLGTLELVADSFRRRSIEIHLVPEAIPEVSISCRGVQISQVLLNLLNNSGAAVAQLAERWVEIRVKVGERELEIRVVDSGAGIPPEVQEHLFEPFFTTKPVGEGTGLGLGISKGICEAHGGSLAYDATSAHTCFVMTLPLASR